jgi:hypothetical protein
MISHIVKNVKIIKKYLFVVVVKIYKKLYYKKGEGNGKIKF